MHGYINIKDLKLTVQCESFRAESTVKSFITSNSRTTNLGKTEVCVLPRAAVSSTCIHSKKKKKKKKKTVLSLNTKRKIVLVQGNVLQHVEALKSLHHTHSLRSATHLWLSPSRKQNTVVRLSVVGIKSKQWGWNMASGSGTESYLISGISVCRWFYSSRNTHSSILVRILRRVICCVMFCSSKTMMWTVWTEWQWKRFLTPTTSAFI